MKAPLLLALTSTLLAACGTMGAQAPAGVPVEILQTQRIVLRGTADPGVGSATCTPSAGATAGTKHVLELKTGTAGTMRLRPGLSESAPLVAVLHVTHLQTNRTWCAGPANASIEGEFPAGTYAIGVAEASPDSAHRYELVVEQL